MNNIDLAINALRKHIGLNEIDNWDFPTRMRVRQTLENVLIILNSEKEHNTGGYMTEDQLKSKIRSRIIHVCNSVGCHNCGYVNTEECIANLQEKLISTELDEQRSEYIWRS